MIINDKQFNKIALIPRFATRRAVELMSSLARHLADRDYEVFIDSKSDLGQSGSEKDFQLIERKELGKKVDLVIVIGGDGTLLEVAYHLADFNVPMIGIKSGRLGFLTDIAVEKMISLTDQILDGKFIKESRLLILGRVVNCDIPCRVALNEIFFRNAEAGKMLELKLFVNEEFVFFQRADGLIISTPTGSTAYSLASGGAILHPSLEALIVVPVCSHSLTSRAIVLPASHHLEVEIYEANQAVATFDGQHSIHLNSKQRLNISRYHNSSVFLRPKDYSYFKTLRKKLHWGESALENNGLIRHNQDGQSP